MSGNKNATATGNQNRFVDSLLDIKQIYQLPASG
jgi:hypothetical protein